MEYNTDINVHTKRPRIGQEKITYDYQSEKLRKKIYLKKLELIHASQDEYKKNNSYDYKLVCLKCNIGTGVIHKKTTEYVGSFGAMNMLYKRKLLFTNDEMWDIKKMTLNCYDIVRSSMMLDRKHGEMRIDIIFPKSSILSNCNFEEIFQKLRPYIISQFALNKGTNIDWNIKKANQYNLQHKDDISDTNQQWIDNNHSFGRLASQRPQMEYESIILSNDTFKIMIMESLYDILL